MVLKRRKWVNGGLEKYRLVGHYADLFTSTMKTKWENLVYIDLFSSSGYATIETTGKIVKTSAMIALSVPNPFTKYIFCDENEKLIKALELRVKRDYPLLNTIFIHGNCNNKIQEILGHIPQYSKTNRVLSFCFVDPFALEIHFQTLKLLGKLKMDFLILIATGWLPKEMKVIITNPQIKLLRISLTIQIGEMIIKAILIQQIRLLLNLLPKDLKPVLNF